jgi:hypothetical protein
MDFSLIISQVRKGIPFIKQCPVNRCPAFIDKEKYASLPGY